MTTRDGLGSARVGKWRAAISVLVAVAAVTIGILLYQREVKINVVPLQMAGSAHAARCLVSPDSDNASCVNPSAKHPGHGKYRQALFWDVWLIAGYGVALALANELGCEITWNSHTRKLAKAGLWMTGAAVAFNAGQDLLLRMVLGPHLLRGDWYFRVIQALAFAKFSALLLAIVTGTCAIATTVGRLVHSLGKQPPAEETSEAHGEAPPAATGAWPRFKALLRSVVARVQSIWIPRHWPDVTPPPQPVEDPSRAEKAIEYRRPWRRPKRQPESVAATEQTGVRRKDRGRVESACGCWLV